MSELEIYKRALKMACNQIYNAGCWCPLKPELVVNCIFFEDGCNKADYVKCWSDYFLSKAHE
jgi:hypothetical protein